MNIESMNQSITNFIAANPWFIALVVWSIIWKLIALWKAARNNHLTIFIVLAFVNTAGIAEIIYLLYLRFRSKKGEAATPEIH